MVDSAAADEFRNNFFDELMTMDLSDRAANQCIECGARGDGLCERLWEYRTRIRSPSVAERQSLKKGDHLFEEGKAVQKLYSLAAGLVLLYRILPDGRRQGVDLLLPGAFFVLPPEDGAISSVSAVCLSPSVVCCFSEDHFFKSIAEDPTIAVEALRRMAKDRVRLNDLLVSLGRRSALERVAHFLDRIRREELEQGGEVSEWLPICQQDLGDILGLTVVHTNRVLRQLRLLGLIETKPGRLKIRDARRLANFVVACDGRAGSVIENGHPTLNLHRTTNNPNT